VSRLLAPVPAPSPKDRASSPLVIVAGTRSVHRVDMRRRSNVVGPDHRTPALLHVRVAEVEPEPLHTGVGVADRGEGQESVAL